MRHRYEPRKSASRKFRGPKSPIVAAAWRAGGRRFIHKTRRYRRASHFSGFRGSVRKTAADSPRGKPESFIYFHRKRRRGLLRIIIVMRLWRWANLRFPGMGIDNSNYERREHKLYSVYTYLHTQTYMRTSPFIYILARKHLCRGWGGLRLGSGRGGPKRSMCAFGGANTKLYTQPASVHARVCIRAHRHIRSRDLAGSDKNLRVLGFARRVVDDTTSGEFKRSGPTVGSRRPIGGRWLTRVLYTVHYAAIACVYKDKNLHRTGHRVFSFLYQRIIRSYTTYA